MNDQSKIEKIKQGLYSRDKEKYFDVTRRHRLRTQNIQDTPGWGANNDELVPDEQDFDQTDIMSNRKTSGNWVSKILILSIVFFIVAAGISAYTFFSGSNIISDKNLGLEIYGLQSVSAGDETTFTIRVKNGNTVDLKTADLLMEYPDGTRASTNLSKDIRRESVSLGDITAGSTIEKKFQVVLFGAENDKKLISASLEYRLPSSNAILNKKVQKEVLISTAPLSLTLTGLKETISGQTTDFVLEVHSNSQKVISGLMLNGDFASGFTLKKSDPAVFSKNAWDLGDLEPGGTRKIHLTGVFDGQEGEEKVLKFTIGLKDKTNETKIGSVFFTTSQTVVLSKPFLSVSVALNGSTDAGYSTQAGKSVRADLTWQNNLPNKINDARFVVKLRGTAINRSTIRVSNGFYQSFDDTIVFDKTTNEKLAVLNPGDTGNLGFDFTLAGNTSLTTGAQNSASFEVSASGRRVGDTGVPESVSYSAVRTLKITSDIRLTSKSQSQTGVFKNIGPIPPVVGQETTYTINWTIGGAINDLSNVVVSARLPNYVKWLGIISPTDEDVTYNSVGGEVVWNVGTIKGGTGRNSPPKNMSFQISFVPSLSQFDTIPTLLTESSARGIDTYTNNEVTASAELLTTNLAGDPNFNSDNAKVTK